jgi:hypothetical protein
MLIYNWTAKKSFSDVTSNSHQAVDIDRVWVHTSTRSSVSRMVRVKIRFYI